METARSFSPDPSMPVPTTVLASKSVHTALGNDVYDFYLCQRCGRIILQPEMVKGLHAGKGGKICPCGGFKYSPAGIGMGVKWYHFLLPRVLKFTFDRWRGVA